MSNNILYLVNDQEESIFPLAKCMADGWYRNSANGTPDEYVENLFHFLESDDGGFGTHTPSNVRVATDSEDLPSGYTWFNHDPPKVILFDR